MELKTVAAGVSRLFGAKGVPDLSSPAPRDDFFEWGARLGPDSMVLEIGTMQSVEGKSTHIHRVFPLVPRERYVMADVQQGADVDVVADLHALPDDWAETFDAVVAVAVFEHLERPWLAVHEIARVLKPGGRCYVATHQTFPLHGYPSDFFRFSREALRLLFEDAGLSVLDCAYEHRTWIRLPKSLVPRRYAKGAYVDTWNRLSPSYIIVHLTAEKGAAP